MTHRKGAQTKANRAFSKHLLKGWPLGLKGDGAQARVGLGERKELRLAAVADKRVAVVARCLDKHELHRKRKKTKTDQ
jgi:hypothetical protein